MNNGTWERQTRLISADGLPIDTLGNCVAIDNNNILVGASLDDVGAKYRSRFCLRLSIF